MFSTMSVQKPYLVTAISMTMPSRPPGPPLTETDELAEAIDAVAPLYPGASRADILRRLIHLGIETIGERQGRHRAAVRDYAGTPASTHLAT